MKVLSIAVLKWKKDTPEPIVLCQECELSQFSYFQKTAVKQMLTFISRTLIQRTNFSERQSVSHEEYMCHCYLRQDGLGAVVVTDKEYPARVAFNLESRLLDEFDAKYMARWKNAKEDNQFPMTTLAKTLQDYQDPAKCDKITQINSQLDETKDVLNKTIDSVLERGTKLDDLVGKSNDLSDQSKMFYKQAKKMNSCCSIM
ncbi:synaptobrevin-like protein [Blastocystis sp. ATCC 50177/Nand II]|uniref:Synaptobrevin-like protein n=1 Tax=Blastocystis sp. subtype 1 (strain ATCC 50177 / NandII) TaxID=478820 RepID=A0A196S5V1_BLAHN|nr:synaptobrevin-like protein [Blastocystis sp. ATCC 50177/Nand II]